ncbi:hypothetical protein PR048_024435 [Dryococelus australis]|uniref:Gustatory receptor n=1 Tax=Dryococelus australis TaxID=614101 RepID=A0ABQ9GNK0_9NEOP|nr:hypothetical protein PR048_024435 [Dryococelus australis]
MPYREWRDLGGFEHRGLESRKGWDEVSMEQRRNLRAGETGDPPRTPAHQRNCPARFPDARIWERPLRESSPCRSSTDGTSVAALAGCYSDRRITQPVAVEQGSNCFTWLHTGKYKKDGVRLVVSRRRGVLFVAVCYASVRVGCLGHSKIHLVDNLQCCHDGACFHVADERDEAINGHLNRFADFSARNLSRSQASTSNERNLFLLRKIRFDLAEMVLTLNSVYGFPLLLHVTANFARIISLVCSYVRFPAEIFNAGYSLVCLTWAVSELLLFTLVVSACEMASSEANGTARTVQKAILSVAVGEREAKQLKVFLRESQNHRVEFEIFSCFTLNFQFSLRLPFAGKLRSSARLGQPRQSSARLRVVLEIRRLGFDERTLGVTSEHLRVRMSNPSRRIPGTTLSRAVDCRGRPRRAEECSCPEYDRRSGCHIKFIAPVSPFPYYSRLTSHIANWVRFPAGSLQEYLIWEPCRTMPLVGRFPRVSPFPPSLHSGVVPYSPRLTLIGSQISSLTYYLLGMLNFTLLYILEPASVLHWLLHRCEDSPFLTELHVIGLHNREVFIYWRRVSQGVSDEA